MIGREKCGSLRWSIFESLGDIYFQIEKNIFVAPFRPWLRGA